MAQLPSQLMMKLCILYCIISVCFLLSVNACDLDELRLCSNNSTDVCCKQLYNPYLNMEAGLYTGQGILSSKVLPRFSDCGTEIVEVMYFIRSLSTLITQFLDIQSLTGEDSLKMNTASALENILSDVKESTCQWLTNCFPLELTCEEYLTEVSLESILLQAFTKSAYLNHILGILPPNKSNPFYALWAENTFCREEAENISLKEISIFDELDYNMMPSCVGM